MVPTTQHGLRMTSVPDNLRQVEKLVDEVTKEFTVNEDCYGNILLAITEAVNNAIFHGNECNPDKEVCVDLEADEVYLTFFVEDQGNGFDPDNLPDPTDPANIEKENGRGVFLMRQLADEVTFQENGKRVILRFKR